MSGLAQLIQAEDLAWKTNLSIGVIVSKSFDDHDYVRDVIKRGVAANPDAVWVRIDTDGIVRDIFAELGIDAVVIGLNPYFKGQGYDVRRVWRDTEMMLCDHLLVFQKQGAASAWSDRARLGVHDCLRLIQEREHGAESKRRVKGRKPE